MTSIAEASRVTGIPEPTIHQWYHSDEFEELRGRKTDVVGEEWWAGIQLAFRRTIELLRNTEDPVKAATAGAIMYDKLALSRGDVTSRSEVSTFHGHNDHEKRAIAELLRRAVADVTEGTAAGDVEGVAVVGAGTPGADSPTG